MTDKEKIHFFVSKIVSNEMEKEMGCYLYAEDYVFKKIFDENLFFSELVTNQQGHNEFLKEA